MCVCVSHRQCNCITSHRCATGKSSVRIFIGRFYGLIKKWSSELKLKIIAGTAAAVVEAVRLTLPHWHFARHDRCALIFRKIIFSFLNPNAIASKRKDFYSLDSRTHIAQHLISCALRFAASFFEVLFFFAFLVRSLSRSFRSSSLCWMLMHCNCIKYSNCERIRGQTSSRSFLFRLNMANGENCVLQRDGLKCLS